MAEKKTGKEKKQLLEKLRTKGIPEAVVDAYDMLTEDDPDIVPGPTYNKESLVNELIPNMEYTLSRGSVPYDKAKKSIEKRNYSKEEAYQQREAYKNRPDVKLKDKIDALENLVDKGMPEAKALERTGLVKTKSGYREMNVAEKFNRTLKANNAPIRFTPSKD